MVTSVFVIIGAYLWGSIPSAYIVARYAKGIDIRGYGSGNVGATNLMGQMGVLTGLALGSFDCVVKGTLPVLLAKLLGLSLTSQALVGLAAIAGHNWSPYIRFTGGRGVATAIGVLVGFLMWKEFLILTGVLGGLGRLVLRETGLATLLSLVMLPVLALLFGQPHEVVLMTLGIGFLLVLKRLVANWNPPARGIPLWRVMLNRFLWDRDAPRTSKRVGRRPRRKRGGQSVDAANEVLQ